MATYLEVVNKVLKRLREPTVAAYNENTYSTLIGELVNQAKREVEDAHNWTFLRSYVDVPVAAGLAFYAISGADDRSKIINVWNVEEQYFLQKAPSQTWIDGNIYMSTDYGGTQNLRSQPLYYREKSVAFGNVRAFPGELTVWLYPIPDSTYTIKFNMVIPQPDLSNDSTVLTVPYYPVLLRAWSLAVSERGEDQGVLHNEIDDMYETALADAIAIDASRVPDEFCWTAG